MPIILPEAFRTILEKDHEARGILSISAHRFKEWIDNSSMRFFPEYTRHDIRHVNEVLSTCAELMTSSALETVTPRDVLVLGIASFLHDSAMYINESTFLEIIGSPHRLPPVQGIDRASWPELWEEYLSQASRFDGVTLMNIFGDSKPARRPPSDPTDYTERDRRLIGEFIRRHHTALAHQFGLHGIPSHRGGYYSLAESCPDHLRDLSGLVARSHGAEMRSYFNYLSQKYDLRDYGGVHAIYLMSALRISDYLQMQPDRAPGATTELQRLRSPLSVNEWNVHQGITNITLATPDPEAIFVKASPPTVRSFLRLRDWLGDLQGELDRTWATLGEVYGRYVKEGLADLVLTIRRIRSNLDEPQELAEEVNYIPERFRFSAADTELLKLLVGPLYANETIAGVRELVQNATDSCREIQDLVKRGVLPTGTPNAQLQADVVVAILRDEQGGFVSIRVTDRGTGMTPQIIQNYFLKAGASFRASDAWRKDFADASGRSRIARTGRFGIGALAAFILGPKIKVTTRHYSSPVGVTFEARIDDRELELHKVEAPVGTEILIELSIDSSRKISNELESRNYSGPRLDFYRSKDPSVLIRVLPENTVLSGHSTVPDVGDGDVDGWRRLRQGIYESVHWRYTGNTATATCNGIVIESSMSGPRLADIFSCPSLSFYDFSGRLPVNLQRDRVGLTESGILDDLARDIAEEFAVFTVWHPPIAPSDNADGTWLRSFTSRYAGVNVYGNSYGNFVFTRDGFQLRNDDVIRQLSPKRIIVLPWIEHAPQVMQTALSVVGDDDLVLFDTLTVRDFSVSTMYRDFVDVPLSKRDLKVSYISEVGAAVGLPLTPSCAFMHCKLAERLSKLKALQVGDRNWLKSLPPLTSGCYRFAKDGAPSRIQGLLDPYNDLPNEMKMSGAAFVFDVSTDTPSEAPAQKNEHQHRLVGAWTSIFGDRVIPVNSSYWNALTEEVKRKHSTIARRYWRVSPDQEGA